MRREQSLRRDLDGGAFLQCLHDGVDGHGAMSNSADTALLAAFDKSCSIERPLVPVVNDHETQIPR